MHRCSLIACIFLIAAGAAFGSGRAVSRHAPFDVSSDTDPDSAFWRGAPEVFLKRDNSGRKIKKMHAEVRSRWTQQNLYFLFICPYTELYLKLGPQTATETQGLWNWDVAEVFLGSNFENINRYREFEVSPQGEWTDLNIDLDAPHHEDGWVWNSGFQVSARVDPVARLWYGFMRIPFASVDWRPTIAGNLLRINFYLSEGKRPKHRSVVWRPTHQSTFHVPQVFGILRLAR